ncbi:MAG: hypothetical protein SNG49_09190 [Rikenellaceae bacterium]
MLPQCVVGAVGFNPVAEGIGLVLADGLAIAIAEAAGYFHGLFIKRDELAAEDTFIGEFKLGVAFHLRTAAHLGDAAIQMIASDDCCPTSCGCNAGVVAVLSLF